MYMAINVKLSYYSHISLGITQATVYAVKGLSNQRLSVHESIHWGYQQTVVCCRGHTGDVLIFAR